MRSATACWKFSPRPRAKSVRASDLIGRLGGEEFAAVLYDTSRDKAVAVAERIRESFRASDAGGRRPSGLRDRQHRARALPRTRLLDVPELLAQADQALYFAKERGRNRVEVASLDMMLKRKGDVPGTPAEQVAAKSAA